MFPTSTLDSGDVSVAPELSALSDELFEQWYGAGPDASAGISGADDLTGRVAAVVSSVRALFGALPELATPAGDSDVVAALTAWQTVANLVAPVDAGLLAEVGRRGAQERQGFPTPASLLVGLLRVRPQEASVRARAAQQFVPRTTLDGAVLPPVREHVAAAMAEGALGADHAAVIDRALHKLPIDTSVDVVDEVEATLVAYARQVDPSQLAKLGRIVVDRFDPDGKEPSDEEIDRRRALRIRQRDDGMGEIHGVLTPETLAAVQAVLTPLAAPRPADDAGADRRSAGQRTHDALDDAMHRLLGSGTLPDCGGVPTSITVLMTLEQLKAGCGLVATDHGATIPVARLLHMATECEYVPVVLDDAGGVLSYGLTRRIAPRGLARALRARDRGCTFPGCRRPAPWTERHHILEHHRDHGATEVDNLALVCRYHHRAFERLGWSVRMIDRRPHWIPPVDVDPRQIPRRNTHWDLPA